MTPRGPFSLAASTRFLEGFTPAAYEARQPGHLHVAFCVEGSWEPVAACARQPEGDVLIEVEGPGAGPPARAQMERVLALDVDGAGFPALGARDPALASLQARYPGLRPVSFGSPYEAAAWALIGQRIRIVQAAAIKARMAEALGTALAIHGETLHAFPAPARLAELGSFPGLTAVKVERLRALGEAAGEGRLDAAGLRGLARDEALARLRELPGVGPFSAELILLRGAGDPDGAPMHEPRLRRAVADAYGLDHEPDDAELAEIAEGWRPYRTWVSVLLRTALEDATDEIAGPGAGATGR